MPPIDPSIISGLRYPKIQLDDPMKNYADSLALKGLVRQDVQGRQSMDDETRVRKLFADNPNATAEQVMAIDPKRGMEMRSTILKNTETQGNIAKNAMEIGVKKSALYRDALSGVNDPATAAQWLTAQHNDPDMASTPIGQADLQTSLSRIPPDPEGFLKWRHQAINGIDGYIKQNVQSADSIASNETSRRNADLARRETPADRLAREKFEWAKAHPNMGGRGGAMSPVAQKEIISTDDEIQGGLAAKVGLKNALDLNDKAMGFAGAKALSTAGTLLPEAMRPGSVDATQNLDNIIVSNVLPQLKATFGGMPTEGERKILIDVQGSVSKSPAVRKAIFERAQKAIDKRLEFSKSKAKSLREGTYFQQTLDNAEDPDAEWSDL